MIEVTSISQFKQEFSNPKLLDWILRDEMKDFSFRYVGRTTEEYPGSVLGNPYKIGRDGNRKQVIEKYRKWLWINIQDGLAGNRNQVFMELVKLGEYYLDNRENQGRLTLICWCHPKGCHADVIKNCIKWMIREGIVLPF